MAQSERTTKRERRERARAERRAAEAAAAKRARRRRVATVTTTLIVLTGVIALFALTAQEPAPQVEVTAAEIEQATQDAGCFPVDVPELKGDHLTQRNAPAPEQLYPVRPPTSGPHFGSPLAPVGFSTKPVDERSAVHNLEHGAVVLWYDPQRVDTDALEDWLEARNRAGFAGGARSGGGIIASPYPGDLPPSKPLALRAWNRALDCDSFAPAAADGFLIGNFGTRGEAPERGMTGYPEDALRLVQ